MGFFGGLFKLVVAVVVVAAAVGGYLYYTDYPVEATITETGEDGSGPYVVVAPAIAPFYKLRQGLDDPQASDFVCEGYDVTYRVNSKYLKVHDRDGRLVYDSDHGVYTTLDLIACAALS